VGFYVTRGRWLANRLPVPRPTLSMSEIWFMWLVSATMLGLTVAASPIVPAGLATVSRGIFDISVGAATLLSVMVLVSYRGQWATKIIMILTLIATISIIVLMYFSKRPLAGIVLAAGAYYYRTHLMKRS